MMSEHIREAPPGEKEERFGLVEGRVRERFICLQGMPYLSAA